MSKLVNKRGLSGSSNSELNHIMGRVEAFNTFLSMDLLQTKVIRYNFDLKISYDIKAADVMVKLYAEMRNYLMESVILLGDLRRNLVNGSIGVM